MKGKMKTKSLYKSNIYVCADLIGTHEIAYIERPRLIAFNLFSSL